MSLANASTFFQNATFESFSSDIVWVLRGTAGDTLVNGVQLYKLGNLVWGTINVSNSGLQAGPTGTTFEWSSNVLTEIPSAFDPIDETANISQLYVRDDDNDFRYVAQLHYNSSNRNFVISLRGANNAANNQAEFGTGFDFTSRDFVFVTWITA